MTTAHILDKLGKLKAAQEGEARLGNSAAAEAFASMINSLLLKHELEAVDIPTSSGKVEQEPIVEFRFDPREHGVKYSRSRVGWQEAMARIVANAHLCGFLVHPGTNMVTFVGTRAQATVAVYAYEVLVAAADRMSREARDDYWREHRDDPDFQSGNYRAAWINGFVGRILERFAEARRAEVRAAASSSTALMRLDQALVRSKDYIKARYTGKAAGVRMATGISAGREAGRAAADRMALGRKGVEGSDRKRIG